MFRRDRYEARQDEEATSSARGEAISGASLTDDASEGLYLAARTLLDDEGEKARLVCEQSRRSVIRVTVRDLRSRENGANGAKYGERSAETDCIVRALAIRKLQGRDAQLVIAGRIRIHESVRRSRSARTACPSRRVPSEHASSSSRATRRGINVNYL